MILDVAKLSFDTVRLGLAPDPFAVRAYTCRLAIRAEELTGSTLSVQEWTNQQLFCLALNPIRRPKSMASSVLGSHMR